MKCEPWREIIRESRLTWLGHLMHLHPGTPAGKTLKEHLRKVKQPPDQRQPGRRQ